MELTLHRELSAKVAGDPYLVSLAAHTRDGQVPTFAFFGAVHALLLGGAEHPLADYYPSLRGDAALPSAGAGEHLHAFARSHETAIIDIVSTRLVQTNQVRRAVGLRLGLAAIAPSLGDRPAHLLEVGSSAGLLLRHAHYGYCLGSARFGDLDSPVQLQTEWRSAQPPPDLDAIPVLASTCGVDLNPLDAAGTADRHWLEALIWPEDRDKAILLHDALTLATRVPVEIMAGTQPTCARRGRRASPPASRASCFTAQPACMCQSSDGRTSTVPSTTSARTARSIGSLSKATAFRSPSPDGRRPADSTEMATSDGPRRPTTELTTTGY